jgi:hypothetical protein
MKGVRALRKREKDDAARPHARRRDEVEAQPLTRGQPDELANQATVVMVVGPPGCCGCFDKPLADRR